MIFFNKEQIEKEIGVCVQTWKTEGGRMPRKSTRGAWLTPIIQLPRLYLGRGKNVFKIDLSQISRKLLAK